MLALRCAALTLALRLGCALAQASACADGQSGACDATPIEDAETSLIQLKRQTGGQAEEFPDFSKVFSNAKGYMEDIASKVDDATSQAKIAANEAVVTGLTTLGDTLSHTFGVLATQADTLQEKIKASKGDITSGIVSAIALENNLSKKIREAIEVPVNASFAQELNDTLALTTKAWKTMDTSALAAVNTIAKGLGAAGLKDAAASFNSTMQAALEKADGFVRSLHDVTLSLWSSGVEKSGSVPVLPEEVLDKVNASLHAAEGFATSFPEDFMRSFTSLEEHVINATSSFLSSEQVATVSASFGGAQAQAQAACDGLGNASTELIEGLEDGLNLTHLALMSGASALHALSVPGVLLVLVLSLRG